MPCLWRKTASFPAKPVERRYHPTLSPHLPSPTAPSLEAVRDARNKRESERAGQVEEKDAADGFHVWCGGLSPRREHLSKGLKPGEEWAVCRWKRSVFQGNQREGKCSVPGGAWGFQRTARGAVWSSTWEEKRGMRFIFTNISVLHTSCLHLQVKKVSLLTTHLNLPSSVRPSGPPDSRTERVDSPLPCDGCYFLYYQQRMSFSKTDFVLYH